MLPDVLWRPLPRLPLGARFFWTIRAVAVIGAMVATAWWPPAALALIAALGTNIVAGVALEQRISVYADALSGLAATMRVARRVAAALPPTLDPRRLAVEERLARLAPLERKVSLVTLRDPTELLQLLQHMVGSKPLAYTAAVDFIEAEIDELRTLYLEVAEIDVAIAVAWLREERSTCHPELGGDAPALMIDGAIHPLLSSPVANDVELAVDRGLLITGSNMSGKTTYLKTIAVNAICAQSIDVAFARAYVHAGARPLRVASSIDRLENLGEGQSYFMAEALSIKAVLEIAAAGPCLVVIDELFRGTNPADRIAAGLAVLDYLGPRALVAIATHDGELGDRLDAGFTERHFRDTWDGAAMQFDYVLRPGRSPRSNAIELLADVGYPAEIVEEAERHRQRPAV
jgi:DNA mismatch repair ATPase MutS